MNINLLCKNYLSKALSYYRKANVAVKASVWFAVCSIVTKGISLITTPIFTRLMSVEQYGQYNVYLTWYNIFIILVTLNIQSEIFNKGLINHLDSKNEFTASQTGLLISLATMWFVLYFLFNNPINKLLGLTTTLTCSMMLEILGTAIVGLWIAQKRFEYDYIKIVVLTIAIAFFNPVVGIIAVIMTEDKAASKLIANAVVPVVVSFGILFSIAKKGRIFGSRNEWYPIVISSLVLLPHYLSLVLLNQSDKLMINHYSGSADAGIYSVAHVTGLIMTIINMSINSSFVPWAYEKIKNNMEYEIKKVSKKLFTIVASVNVFLIWLGPEAIKIIAAPEYSDAVWCLVPIAISVFFYFAYTLFVDVEIYYGANYCIAVSSICAAVLNVILNYVFIPIWGYMVAGYTTLFSYFVTMLLHLIFLKIELHKHKKENNMFDIPNIFLQSLIMILLSAVAMMLYHHAFIRIGIIILTVVIILCLARKIAPWFLLKKDTAL